MDFDRLIDIIALIGIICSGIVGALAKHGVNQVKNIVNGKDSKTID